MPRRFIRVNVSRIKPYVYPVQIEKRCTDLPKNELKIEKTQKKQIPNFEEKSVEKETQQLESPLNLAPTTKQLRVQQQLLSEQDNLAQPMFVPLPNTEEPIVVPPVIKQEPQEIEPPNVGVEFDYVPYYTNPFARHKAIVPEFVAPLSQRKKQAFMQLVRRKCLPPKLAAANKAACEYVASCLLVASVKANSPPPPSVLYVEVN